MADINHDIPTNRIQAAATMLDRESTDVSNTTAEVPVDDVFEVLRNQRRRLVISLLDMRKQPVTLHDLVSAIAFAENDVASVDELTEKQRKRVHVGLHQTHLGILESADAIEWDDENNIIRAGSSCRALAEMIHYTRDHFGVGE